MTRSSWARRTRLPQRIAAAALALGIAMPAIRPRALRAQEVPVQLTLCDALRLARQ